MAVRDTIMNIASRGIFRDNQVNTIAADALAARVAMFSTAVLLTL